VTPLLAQRPRADRAFERLYRKHVHAVYRYSLAVLHNQADAEDVTQITFMSAYRAFCRGERPERAHNWLIKIAHNVCRQRFRESARRPQEVALGPQDTMAAPEPDGDVPTAEEIRRALGFLSFNQRAALVMRELEGRSYAEIGEVLSLSIAAVETLLFRGRRALREQLGGGLTCDQAEVTLSQLQERRLSNAERGELRAHLRECKDCAALERRQRAQRAALRGIATIPLPASLSSFFGSGAVGGGAAVAGTGLAAKAAAVLAAGLVSAGIGREVIQADAAQKPARNVQATAVRGKAFSPVSSITGGRAAANPIAERMAAAGQRYAAGAAGGRSNSANRRRLIDGDAGDTGDAGDAGDAGAGSSKGAGQPAQTHPVESASQTVAETVPVPLPQAPKPALPPVPPVQVPPVPPLPPAPPAPVPPVPPVPPLPPPPPLLK
jgi:RNA polymerase sigma factor (sigma-70 family)